MKELLYADANATTPVLPEAYERMREFLGPEFGNPSSGSHPLGHRAREAVESARAQVAALIQASPEEIVFTGGGTEACFLGISGGALGKKEQRKCRRLIAHSGGEHSAVIEAAKFLERELGFSRTEIPLDKFGALDHEAARRVLQQEGSLASIMLANNETGVLFPVSELCGLQREMLIHSDATQAVGKIPVSVAGLGVDLLSFSGHKFGAPKGIGALYIRQGTPFTAVMPGGGQEGGRRGGTESVPLIVALGEAARFAQARLAEARNSEAARDAFEERLKRGLSGFVITGEEVRRIPNTSHLRIDGVIGSELVQRLEERGAICSTGSACRSGKLETSPVLTSMGLSPGEALGAIRISFLSSATEGEALKIAEILAEETAQLRRIKGATLSNLLR